MHESLIKWMKQLPVEGFNSGRYDLNAMMTAFFPFLLEQTKVEFVTEKNSYMRLSSEGLRLLDMVSYLAAGTSYSKFLKAFNVQETKRFFLYEWCDDLKKLDSDKPPPHEAFFSTLKNSIICVWEFIHTTSVYGPKKECKVCTIFSCGIIIATPNPSSKPSRKSECTTRLEISTSSKAGSVFRSWP